VNPSISLSVNEINVTNPYISQISFVQDLWNWWMFVILIINVQNEVNGLLFNQYKTYTFS
jgi:hypothetical protein